MTYYRPYNYYGRYLTLNSILYTVKFPQAFFAVFTARTNSRTFSLISIWRQHPNPTAKLQTFYTANCSQYLGHTQQQITPFSICLDCWHNNLYVYPWMGKFAKSNLRKKWIFFWATAAHSCTMRNNIELPTALKRTFIDIRWSSMNNIKCFILYIHSCAFMLFVRYHQVKCCAWHERRQNQRSISNAMF